VTEVFGRAFWDERYRSRSALWSGEPNPHLISHASELSAGTALDVEGLVCERVYFDAATILSQLGLVQAAPSLGGA